MRDEIAAAVVFLARVLREHHSLPKDKVADFSDSLSAILVERFKNHWYTEKPLKGQAYRCVRLSPNQHHDPVLKRAAIQSDLELEYLNLPVELQLWIDPSEVTCRLGDHKCNQCLVASFKEGDIENNALTLDISCMLEKHQEDDAKNLTYLSCRSNKNYSSYSKCYSPTEDWQEKGYYDTDKESLEPLWIEDYGDQYHYFLKDVRDKRMYLKQQHNSQNRYQQVFTTRHHYYNPSKQVSPSSTYTKSSYNSSPHVQYNSSGTTYFRPIVKNRYQWVRGSNASQTIAA